MVKKEASHDVYLRFWSNRPFFDQNRITTLHFNMCILSLTDKPLFSHKCHKTAMLICCKKRSKISKSVSLKRHPKFAPPNRRYNS